MRYLLAMLLLGGCTAQGSVAPGNPFSTIHKITTADLQAALADAQAANDAPAVACWSALLTVQQIPLAGAISTFQRGRDLMHIAKGPCADVIIETQQFALTVQMVLAGGALPLLVP